MKMSKWIGYAVSVNCGEPLGCYQGTILEADGTTITLTKAFRNGFPYPKSQVTLNAADIKDLKIIEAKTEPAEQTHSTVAVSKNAKKASRATVCESLQTNPSSTGNQQNSGNNNVNNNIKPSNTRSCPAPERSKPIDIQCQRNKNNQTGSYGNAGSTPKGRVHDKNRRRNEACFGDAAELAIDDDFDFEGNLALFDKRALWERMRAAKPDLVRQADDAAKLRHDENVLGPAPAARGPRVPDALRGPTDYVTDAGEVLPAVTPALRRRLWRALTRHELADGAYTLLARAAADLALRLVGGGRRLEARNAHQAPRVAVLCGAHACGAAALQAARLLASHGARVQCAVVGQAPQCVPLQRELTALRLDGVPVAESPDALAAPELALVALHEPSREEGGGGGEGVERALSWVRGARCALVAVEPSARGWEGVSVRASLVCLAPPALPACLGRLYLADVAPPRAIFEEHGVAYRPPFGAHSLLALHPADD